MNPRAWLAIKVGRSIHALLKATGRGATAAPGYYALKIDPDLLKHLSKKLSKIVLITGTNGKTTTARLLVSILEKNGHKTIHNRAGSNLLRGIVSTLISQSQFDPETIGIFEVDELALAPVCKQLKVDCLIVNNLFRDQLDRYGEVATVYASWKKTLLDFTDQTTILLNSDDPNVCDLGRGLKAKVVYFGLEDKSVSFKEAPHTVDARVCPVDSKPLRYDYYYLAHLGNYHCPGHDFRRSQPTYSAEKITVNGVKDASFTLNFAGPRSKVTLPMSGLFNVYNSLGAGSVAYEMGIPKETIASGLKETQSAFGRQQKFQFKGKDLSLNLVKNPVGYNEVLRLLEGQKDLHLWLLLNDNLADGTDVSWIWDVDFESLKEKTTKITVSGTRSLELANRLKYAMLDMEKVTMVEDLGGGLKKSLEGLSEKQTLFVLPTYTAMLGLQKLLAKEGVTKAFWED